MRARSLREPQDLRVDLPDRPLFRGDRGVLVRGAIDRHGASVAPDHLAARGEDGPGLVLPRIPPAAAHDAGRIGVVRGRVRVLGEVRPQRDRNVADEVLVPRRAPRLREPAVEVGALPPARREQAVGPAEDLHLLLRAHRVPEHRGLDEPRAVEVDHHRDVGPERQVEVVPVRGEEHGVGLDPAQDLVLGLPAPEQLPLRLRDRREVLLREVREARHRREHLDAVGLEAPHELVAAQPAPGGGERAERHEVVGEEEDSHRRRGRLRIPAGRRFSYRLWGAAS